MEGLDNGFFKCLWRIGALQIQKSTHVPYPSATGTFFELFDILIESLRLSKQGLFLLAGTLMGSFAVQRGMVSLSGDSGLPFIDEPWMIGHLLIFEEDLDPVPHLMNFDLLPNESFWRRIAVGVDLHIACHIHPPIKSLIDRRDIGRKGVQMGFFHQVGGFRADAQGALDLLVCNLHAPPSGLLV